MELFIDISKSKTVGKLKEKISKIMQTSPNNIELLIDEGRKINALDLAFSVSHS